MGGGAGRENFHEFAPVGYADFSGIVFDDAHVAKIVESADQRLARHAEYGVHIFVATLEHDVSAVVLSQGYYPVADALLERTACQGEDALYGQLCVHGEEVEVVEEEDGVAGDDAHVVVFVDLHYAYICLLYTSPSPRDA